MNEREFEENVFGLRVKRCCASCGHKEMSQTEEKRHCLKHKVTVSPSGVCREWIMSEGLKGAGCAKGDVRDIKTKEVLF